MLVHLRTISILMLRLLQVQLSHSEHELSTNIRHDTARQLSLHRPEEEIAKSAAVSHLSRTTILVQKLMFNLK